MEVGINISQKRPYDEQIRSLKRCGIGHTFVGAEHPELDKVINCLTLNGIICDNLHAPYNNINDMWSNNDELADAMLLRLFNSVDCCVKYGIPVVVVHLSSGRPMPPITESGERRFAKLFDYAKINGIIVAVENQRFLENFSYFVDKYDVGFCWDCGHEYGFSKGIRFMEMYGDRCVALHIHDNRCGDNTDDHYIPFDGNIDFNVIAKTIASKKYKGTLMLEVGKKNSIYDNMSEEEYICRASVAANKLSDMVEKLR